MRKLQLFVELLLLREKFTTGVAALAINFLLLVCYLNLESSLKVHWSFYISNCKNLLTTIRLALLHAVNPLLLNWKVFHVKTRLTEILWCIQFIRFWYILTHSTNSSWWSILSSFTNSTLSSRRIQANCSVFSIQSLKSMRNGWLNF